MASHFIIVMRMYRYPTCCTISTNEMHITYYVILIGQNTALIMLTIIYYYYIFISVVSNGNLHSGQEGFSLERDVVVDANVNAQ